jgi:hypothetical protein
LILQLEVLLVEHWFFLQFGGGKASEMAQATEDASLLEELIGVPTQLAPEELRPLVTALNLALVALLFRLKLGVIFDLLLPPTTSRPVILSISCPIPPIVVLILHITKTFRY